MRAGSSGPSMTVTRPQEAVQTKRGASLRQRASAEGSFERLSGAAGIRESRVSGSVQVLSERLRGCRMEWLWHRGSGGRFADDELGCEPDGVGKGLIGRLNTFDEQLCGGQAHLVQGLTDGGEAGIRVFSDENVIESDDGDIAGAGEASVFDGTDGSDGGGVVETEDGGEVAGAAEEFADGWITELGGPGVFLEIDTELREDYDSDLLGDGVDGLPARFGIEGESLAFHEGYAAMA